MCRRGHDTGRRPHGPAHRSGQRHGSGPLGTGRVRRFIGLHLLDEGTRSGVRGGQTIEVALEVLLDLPFGLDDEAQAQRVAGPSSQKSEGEGTCIPERIEKARAGIEFAQPLACPREVVRLFPSSLLELLAEGRIAGGECAWIE